MAGFGWNSSLGNTISSNSNGFPTTPIACRLCDEVFMSVSALITHVEGHILSNAKQHEPNINQPLQIQGDSSVNPIHPSSSPTPPPEPDHPLSQNIGIFNTAVQNYAIAKDYSNNLANGSMGEAHIPASMGESASDDSTMPLLQKLQRHYPYKLKLREMDNEHKNMRDLDLTLRL
ncbi:hypothetical protein K2173_011468 [Erythroxylum novogranatense]|uniref:C2H2-type domain-containing protein n=1 Tax=Erythroxylum novogranatense TaxID=1862640 RepID=A0AAV8TER6_9ROSI|nr:hypothetical protein K2173_011468 [Erythroxylum novogranatense]